MTISDLPTLNAFLNGISAIFLLTGFYFIRNKKISKHKFCMIAAFITSAIFLTSYLIYHYYHLATKFPGSGIIALIYYVILFTHVVLAIVILPIIFITFSRAFKKQYEKHRRIARWTFPIWLYVSVTGVIVYLMLYQMY